jgi:hypothetical protein
MRYRAAAVIAALLVLSATATLADTLSMALGSVCPITGPIGEQTRARVLITLTPPQDALNAQIDFVLLLIPPLGLTDSGAPVTIEAHKVTTGWDAGTVTWTQPWQEAGGDFDPAFLACGVTAAGDTHRIKLDVTSAVRAWQAGAANNGVIFTRPSLEGNGFASEASNLSDALQGARVILYYHNVR